MYKMSTENEITKESILSPFVEDMINKIIEEAKKKKHRDNLMKNMIEPILEDINDKYYPHMMTLMVLLCLIIILLTLLLIANVKTMNACNK